MDVLFHFRAKLNLKVLYKVYVPTKYKLCVSVSGVSTFIKKNNKLFCFILICQLKLNSFKHAICHATRPLILFSYFSKPKNRF